MNLNATSTENWLFGIINTTSTSYKRHIMLHSHAYDFLHFAKIKINLLCSQDHPLKQMTILIRMSSCHKIYDQFVATVANNIPTITDSCLMITYTFTAVKTRNKNIKNYNDFFMQSMDILLGILFIWNISHVLWIVGISNIPYM